MSDNHHDESRLDQLDPMLRGEGIDTELLHALGNTIPEAEAAFQHNLEDQLMARLNNQLTENGTDTEDDIMKLFGEKQKRGRSSRLPLTLAAAVLAILLVGGLVYFVQGASDNEILGAEMQNTETAQNQVRSTATPDQFALTATQLVEDATAIANDQVLTINRAGCVYKGPSLLYDVQEGDTLFSIMTDFDVTMQDIMVANCIDAPIYVEAGETYTIPLPSEQINMPRIALVVGHLDEVNFAGEPMDGGAVCDDGLRETDLNQSVADSVALPLQRHGYTVQVFGHNDPALRDYDADLVLELHTGSCEETIDTSGFMLGYAPRTQNTVLNACIHEQYADVTGLSALEDYIVTADSTYAIENLRQGTPAAVLQMGILSTDRETLINNREMVITGIVYSITCFLPPQDYKPLYNELSPMVIANREIAMNEIITDDMLTVIAVPNEFMNRFHPPTSGYMNVISSPELAIGRVASEIIPAYAPILMRNTRPPADCDAVEADCMVIPTGRVAISLPSYDLTPLSMTIGQHVDVLATFSFADVGEDFQAIVADGQAQLGTVSQTPIMTIVSDAILVDTNNLGDNFLVTLAIRAEDADVLLYLADAAIPMHFVPHVDVPENIANAAAPVSMQNLSNPSSELGANENSFTFTTTDATPLQMRIGERVDIMMAALTIDMNGEYQRFVDEASLPLEVMPDLHLMRISLNAVLLEAYGNGDDVTVTLGLTSENRGVLENILNSNMPIRFVEHIDFPDDTSDSVDLNLANNVSANNSGSSLAIDCVANDSCVYLPDGYVAFALPTRDEVVTHMQTGQRIDIIASVLSNSLDENGLYQSSEIFTGPLTHYASPAYVTKRVLSDAMLIFVEDAPNGSDGYLAMIAFPQAYATLMTNVAAAHLPTYIVPHVPGSSTSDDGQAIMRGFQLTDDGLAIVTIPLDQIHTNEVIDVGDMVDVSFSLPYQADGTTLRPTPEAGDVYSMSNPTTVLQIEDSTVLYVGRGNGDYVNPHDDGNNQLFMALTVNLTEAWLVDWYVANEASFSLRVDDLAINRTSREDGIAFAFPIAALESIPFNTSIGDTVTIELDNLSDDNDTLLENVNVLYIGRDPSSANISQNLIYWDGDNEEDGFIVVLVSFEQHQELFELTRDDTVFRITEHEDTTPPIITISVQGIGDLNTEQILIRNEDYETIGLNGWALEDENGNRYTFGDIRIFANAQHSVRTGQGRNSPLISYWGLNTSVWEAGEMVSLYDANGILRALYAIPSQ